MAIRPMIMKGRKQMDQILQTVDLCKYYGKGENEVKAVQHANLEIQKGEFVAIVGKSGSGKSTLLHMMGGLDTPTSGKVLIRGKDIFSYKDDALAVFRRRKIGFIFSLSILSLPSTYGKTSCSPRGWTEERPMRSL